MHRRTLLLAAALSPLASLPAIAADPVIQVAKSPTCGCCGAWEEHLRISGFKVDSHPIPDENLWALKAKLGITDDTSSCHTAMIDGYVIEGHVPADDIRRLLAERPDAVGLTVPGMPIGSPGMEMGGEVEPYDTLLIRKDGSTEVFASHS
ncbi:hypothetical protein BXY66_4129 [Shimia isoporae]|uniref:Metal-binding protein n=1 Tax=Shimia isoporae TaxID=647720 RepID=A0A4R1MZV4_9RHOB|nr:DUF411 domain-containing protein [Shimia isoporae]TCK98887.1 hypothetical protein BXY66_4129 [Shimia isoporae]